MTSKQDLRKATWRLLEVPKLREEECLEYLPDEKIAAIPGLGRLRTARAR